MSVQKIIHDLRIDYHNMINLLGFIDRENILQDEELKEMLKTNLARAVNVTKNLDELKKGLEE